MTERDPNDKGFTVIDRRGSAQADAPAREPEAAPSAAPPAPRVDFSMLVQSIAVSALHYLGLAPAPEGAPAPAVDLPLARHNIEILELLEEKTRGNLSQEEARLIAGLLYEVRMHFVEATRSPGS